ncbi:MAG: ABC transporter ATP-binding protein [Lachnospiraceae bacterium]|nr:ABC transporter ATP-binding protein [Lachnospiraceae bacterium]
MVVKIQNLVKRYGSGNAADHVSLLLEEGEMAGVFGPGGCGKSTVIKSILGLTKVNRGEIELFGRKLENAPQLRRDIGYVPQEPILYQELTVYENIEYFCGLYVKDKKQRIQDAEEAVEWLGMRDFWKFYPRQLNESLLKRLNFACGIAHKPSLLLLDDPMGDIDLLGSHVIREKIIELNQKGTTILYTTRNAEDVEILSGKIIMLDRGRVIAQGTKEELKEMIGIGEKITIEAYHLGDDILDELKTLPNVCDVAYYSGQLTMKSGNGKHNLINILNFLQERDVSIGSVYSERPTLNDVYLEMTGKELGTNEIA